MAMALPFDPTKGDQTTPPMSDQPIPSPSRGRKQASTTRKTTMGSDVNKDPKRSEGAPISKSKDNRVMAPPPKPKKRRKRAPGPPPDPKDKRPPLPPGGPRNPYDWIWDRELLEAYLYLYEPRIDYVDVAKSLGCSGRALEEHLKLVKKRATAKYEAKDKDKARALRAHVQGITLPTTSPDETTEAPDPATTEDASPRRTRVSAKTRGRPPKANVTPKGHRKRVASSITGDGEVEGEAGPSPSKKAREDGPSHGKRHSHHHRKHRVASSPTTAAAAEEEEKEGSPTKKVMSAVASPHTPSRKRVASAENEDASPVKKTALTPKARPVENSTVAAAQVDGSPATAADDDDNVSGRRQEKAVLPTLGDLLDGLVKRDGGEEARMRFEDSLLGEVQDMAIGRGRKEGSGLRDDDDDGEEEDEEQRMQEGMGQVEMAFE